MKKITFLGDIMCEESLLRSSKQNGNYDFSQVFEGCKELFAEADFVVGNLETVFAGKENGYTNSVFSFNTPDEFAEAMAKFGVDMVTTATNHALDRDKAGMLRTLDVLDRFGIEHIGTSRTATDRENVYYKVFDGKSVAFLNYTYGTNMFESPFLLPDEEYYCLNLLMPQKKVTLSQTNSLKTKVARGIYKIIPLKYLLKIKKMIGREYVNRYTDTLADDSLSDTYIEKIKNDIVKAKEQCDIVIACLHIGGQFNAEPGQQVEYFTKLFSDMDVDYLINTHAHVVQKSEKIQSTFVAHCLGNFSISPSSIYVPHELKPEYSIALHLYVGDEKTKIGFSILKIIENKKHEIMVVPVDQLVRDFDDKKIESLQQDVTFIYNRFTGKQIDKVTIEKEYLIEV